MTTNTTLKLAIFYNTFSGINHTELADKIVKEQLKSLSLQPLFQNASIFYYRIGKFEDWSWLDTEYKQDGLACTQIGARKRRT